MLTKNINLGCDSINYLAYNDEIKTELLNGKIISMSPRPTVNHNIAAGNIYRLFSDFLDDKPCTTFSYGVDIYLSENDRVIPDIMIICNKDLIKHDGIYGTPDLIAEVLSPSTAKNDKGYKKNLYEKTGVKEYWIVDTANKSIEVYLLKENKYILDNVYSIYPNYLIEKMTEEEKERHIMTHFKTSLFTDFNISIEKVFKGMF